MYISFQRDLNPLHPYQLQTFGEPVSWLSLSLCNTGSGTSMEKQAMQFTILLVLKIFHLWTGGMVQKIKMLAVSAEDPSFIPRIPVVEGEKENIGFHRLSSEPPHMCCGVHRPTPSTHNQ